MLYAFKFEDVFATLFSHLDNDAPSDKKFDKAIEQSEKIEEELMMCKLSRYLKK